MLLFLYNNTKNQQKQLHFFFYDYYDITTIYTYIILYLHNLNFLNFKTRDSHNIVCFFFFFIRFELNGDKYEVCNTSHRSLLTLRYLIAYSLTFELIRVR